MADIRALERADLPEVASLLRANLPGWALSERILDATVLEYPWSDDELPSLVAVDDGGAVVGFVGTQVRRMRFDNREIRGVCGSHLVVSPAHRMGAPGALLLGRLLGGPQQITWSDSTTQAVVRVWGTFKGSVDHARATDFMLVLSPFKWVRSIVRARVARRKIDRSVVPVGAFPFHAASTKLTRRAGPSGATGIEGANARAEAIVEVLPELSRQLRVQVAWDAQQLQHTFDQIEAVNGGLVSRVVSRRGRPIGWYAYLVRPDGVSRVLHLAAIQRAANVVLGELVEHATASGSTVLAGRAEPHLEEALRERLALLNFAWQPVIRARDPELAATLSTGASLLTRMDGELSTSV